MRAGWSVSPSGLPGFRSYVYVRMTDDTPGEWSGSGEFDGVSERLEEPMSDEADANVA